MEVTDGVKMDSWCVQVAMVTILIVQHVEVFCSVFHIHMDARAQQDVKG